MCRFGGVEYWRHRELILADFSVNLSIIVANKLFVICRRRRRRRRSCRRRHRRHRVEGDGYGFMQSMQCLWVL